MCDTRCFDIQIVYPCSTEFTCILIINTSSRVLQTVNKNNSFMVSKKQD
jgi:hypothetical protein